MNEYKRQVITVLAAFLIMTVSRSLAAEECRDTVVIDSVVYTVPTRWCGHKMDSTQIADKTRLVRLPAELCFEDYRIYVLPETRDALVKMAAAARADSIELIVDSGFRSAAYQKRIYRRRLAEGESFDKIVQFVAPPGYSEHETGRAVDMVPSNASFAHTEAYRWLKKNAHKFGFYETYPETKEGLIPWESSHWCYQPSE
ncbi:MAG: M15 family metallopeptidase [candidate division Zixibacteria bacterium]|nr:M15 family metallopeptidase [candidate division Zixibacteria bacterium]